MPISIKKPTAPTSPTETGRTSLPTLAVAPSAAKPKPRPLIIRPTAPQAAQGEIQSPFRTNIGGEFPDKNVALAKTAQPLQSTAPVSKLVIKPKATIRPLARPAQTTDATPTERQSANLADAGLTVKEKLGIPPSGPQYERCIMGTRVTITNSSFPWVKHYKPGDSGLVTHIGNNKDPMGIDDTSHLLHVIKIDKQGDGKKDRIGQTAALFRWEFQIGDMVPASQWESRKVVYE